MNPARLPANVVALSPRNSAHTGQHPVLRALKLFSGRSDNELARLMGVSAGESSKRWREVVHLLEVARAGKERRIALKRAA